ncbi:MAG: low molecular weight protein-tyrosine-phosphatase [Candidatus Woesearchaeota archaeon]
MKIKVLFVCMGNICRSPAAEAVFKKITKNDKKFLVDSAGVIGFHAGSNADNRMIKTAKKRDIIITSISRKLTKQDLEEFDYIVVMDDQNYEDVLNLSTNENEYKILKMANFLSAKHKNHTKIPDPYYGGIDGFELVLDLLEDSCNNLYEHISNS